VGDAVRGDARAFPRLRAHSGIAPWLAIMAVGLIFVGSASAAITHEYLPPLSKTFSEGVPKEKGCLETPPLTEPPCISGPLAGANAIAIDGTNAWIADGSRIDRFNATTGAFEGPQLDEEGGASGLGGALGVGKAFGGEQVYVDAAGGVAVFNGVTGKLAGPGFWSGAHTKAGAFANGVSILSGVAVDQSSPSSLDEDKGDVYVATSDGGAPHPEVNVVDVFSPKKAEEEGLKAGEEPAEPVAELDGTCASGVACPEGEQFHEPKGVAVSPVNGDVLVADGPSEPEKGSDCSRGRVGCVVDVFEPESGFPGHYRFLFSIAGALGSSFVSPRSVAVDGGTGEIYVFETSAGVVDQFSSTGTYLGRIKGTPSGGFPTGETIGLGVDGETHDVLVGDPGASPALAVFGENIVIPDVATVAAGGVHASEVTLNGTVKLDGAGPATCVFEYGTSTSYGETASCEPETVKESEEVGGEPVPVKATVTHLQSDTTYFYRVSATNELGGVKHTNNEGSEDHGEVSTSGPGLHGESVSEVASSAASLDATINPDGSPTSYYFQYNATGTAVCETHPEDCTSIPVTLEEIGSAAGEVNVSQRIQGLNPETVYHYRVVVLSEPKLGEKAEEFPGEDQTFTTQPAGSGFTLPDGRQWEQVSPPDKHGASIAALLAGAIGEGWVTKASSSGGAFTYLASNPTEANVLGYASQEQVLATRGGAGSSSWSSQDISLPHSGPVEDNASDGNEYRLFSEDLSLGLAERLEGFTSLKPFAFPPDTELTPYLRHNLTCSASPGTCFQPLVTGAPGSADVLEGTTFGESGKERGVKFAAASPDLAHVVINSEVALKRGLSGGGLYEFSAAAPVGEEQLQLVSVLPGGPTNGSTGGRGAVSADGSRVFWSGAGGSYMRDVPRSETLAIPGGVQIADREGNRVFITGPGGLEVCEIPLGTGPLECRLTDLTPTPPGQQAAVLGGALGASEDGSYVYYVSNAVLGDGAQRGALPGDCPAENSANETEAQHALQSCNLYMSRYDSASQSWEAPVFIAALSGNDSPDWSPVVAYQTARVSPNGTWLTFMSERSFTGYDNHDAHSGRPDEEVFLYDGETQELVCASCDPSGARPDGREVGRAGENRLAAEPHVWENTTWLAANIPAWDTYEIGHAAYQSRFLSNSGRLFFNSSDALVPHDVNNQEDVYQWEPAGAGSCSSSAPGFNSSTGGCVGLISSGISPDESAFLDASENGDDVFFLTAEKLVPSDVDNTYDVYDAHVCGAEGVSCAPPLVAAPACETADACRAVPTAPPEVFGAPPSATFNGPGNQAPAVVVKPKPTKCKKGDVKNKKGKCVKKPKKKQKARAKKSTHHQGAK